MRARWRDTVTRVRAPLVPDEYGTPGSLRDWESAVETDIPGCSVQPLAGTEYEIDREAVITRWRLFAPAGTDLVASDRLRWKGDLYELDGAPADFAGYHLEALLRRVTG